MKKINRLTNALSWRFAVLNQKLSYLGWYLKGIFDFSKKEKIDSVTMVVVGRNDNYGGNFSQRLQVTLDWNFSHLPGAELIYVEWNQIKERPSDCEWISKRYPNSKCYIVPKEIHKKIAANPDKMPVMEYFGKNLGIRNAGNSWILLINADCFIGYDVIKKIHKLNRDTVYGTHYVSIEWDEKPISDYHLRDTSLVRIAFPAGKKMGSVVGNFILTHKTNWIKATGYDERLTDTRAGVDTNGLNQLLHLGLKPMVIGHHLHLDHPESIVNSSNSTHGAGSLIDKDQNIPYKNPDGWGLINYSVKQTGERIWELEPI